MAFAVQARLDSLLERTETIGSKIVETFEGRDDHLMYRSVRYSPVERQQSDLRCVLVFLLRTFSPDCWFPTPHVHQEDVYLVWQQAELF